MFVAHIAEGPMERQRQRMERFGVLACEEDCAALTSCGIGYRWLLRPTIGLKTTREARGYVAVAGASRPLGFVLS